MKILTANIFTPTLPQHNKNEYKQAKTSQAYNSYMILPVCNEYLLTFGARVDKSAERFYDTNIDRTPETVKNYLLTLNEDIPTSPLEIQQQAFAKLQDTNSAEEIKRAFPNETLFQSLINPENSNARRGIIKAINDYSEMLEQDGKGILQSKENFTAYLVKKIFLENKTIEELNADLDVDLEPEFKQVFLFHNEDAKFIYTSTLDSLGIRPPASEYRQSLRYTREGYSDIIGQKIADAQRAFWNSMPEEERTARARKSVAKFENWWTSLPHNKKLEMIAQQDTLLAMLKDFKDEQKQAAKSPKTTAKSTTPRIKSQQVHPGSVKLSQDELFLKWAENNLKIFNESLTEADKDTLHIKRMRNLANRWKDMSAVERTDYISKMKSGSEPLRYAMINAWNQCTDILKALSSHLKANQIYKPADMLYSNQAFSQFQSDVMREFWEKNPDFAVKLGEKIQQSHEKIRNAISGGTFEELKRQIMRDKNQRIKEMEAFKKTTVSTITTPAENDYLKDFRQAYLSAPATKAQMKNMPQSYIEDYFKVIGEGYTQEAVEAWTRNLKNEPSLPGDLDLLRSIAHSEPPQSQRINRAIEAALANVLYDCTRNPEVFRFSHSDAKTAIAQIDRGENEINIVSHKLQENFKIPLIKRKIDKNKIASLYQAYKEALPDKDVYKIVTSFFDVRDTATENALEEYLHTFGKSANIIFSPKSIHPNTVKEKLFKKFMDNMPETIRRNIHCYIDDCADPFGREDTIKRINYKIGKRFSFVPTAMLDYYQDEIGRGIRQRHFLDLEAIELKAGTKRKNPKSTAGIVILPKENFKALNKLKLLAAEQVLAEALYDSTKNPEVFALHFEELCDNIELFSMIKKFPSESRSYPAQGFSEPIVLTAREKINLRDITEEFIACTNDVTDNWLNTEVKREGLGRLKTLTENLAGQETNPKILEYIAKRIKYYGLRLK